MSTGYRILWCFVIAWTIVAPSHDIVGRVVDLFVTMFGLIMITRKE